MTSGARVMPGRLGQREMAINYRTRFAYRQVDKVAHLPELRFALGEPEVETTSIDNAAAALETASFFIRRVGTDGFRIHHQATLKKVVSDRRASLDEETTIRKLVETEFARGLARANDRFCRSCFCMMIKIKEKRGCR
jgi:hypothetical protein